MPASPSMKQIAEVHEAVLTKPGSRVTIPVLVSNLLTSMPDEPSVAAVIPIWSSPPPGTPSRAPPPSEPGDGGVDWRAGSSAVAIVSGIPEPLNPPQRCERSGPALWRPSARLAGRNWTVTTLALAGYHPHHQNDRNRAQRGPPSPLVSAAGSRSTRPTNRRLISHSTM